MHKLKLHPEMLRVESFATDAMDPAPRGTVDAYAKPTQLATGCPIVPESQNCPATYNQAATCAYSCDGGCFPLTSVCEPWP
jgi:hypothetical protein